MTKPNKKLLKNYIHSFDIPEYKNSRLYSKECTINCAGLKDYCINNNFIDKRLDFCDDMYNILTDEFIKLVNDIAHLNYTSQSKSTGRPNYINDTNINLYKFQIAIKLFIGFTMNDIYWKIKDISYDEYATSIINKFITYFNIDHIIYDTIKESLKDNYLEYRDIIIIELTYRLLLAGASCVIDWGDISSNIKNIITQLIEELDKTVESVKNVEENNLYDDLVKLSINIKNIDKYKSLYADCNDLLYKYFKEEEDKRLISSILEFQCEGRPIEELNIVFNRFKNEYNFKGRLFHGISNRQMNENGNKSVEEVFNGYNGIMSFTKDINIARHFASCCVNEYGWILVTECIDENFDLHKYMTTLDISDKNHFNYLIDKYISEKEVLGYLPKNYDIIKLEDVKLNSHIGLDYLKHSYLDKNGRRFINDYDKHTIEIYEYAIPQDIKDNSYCTELHEYINSKFNNDLVIIKRMLKEDEFFINNNFIDITKIDPDILPVNGNTYVYNNDKLEDFKEYLKSQKGGN